MCMTVFEIDELAHRERKEGKQLIVTLGVFDVLHVGHVRYLECQKLPERLLVVGIDPDSSVLARKGAPPLFTSPERAEVLSALRCVDFVFIASEEAGSIYCGMPELAVLKPDIFLASEGTDFEPDRLKRIRSLCKQVTVVPRMSQTSSTWIASQLRAHSSCREEI